MRISDWSSDVCSSDLAEEADDAVVELVHVEVGGVDDDVGLGLHRLEEAALALDRVGETLALRQRVAPPRALVATHEHVGAGIQEQLAHRRPRGPQGRQRGPEVEVVLGRSEEHTSELQSLMRNSYAVFCLQKKTLTLEA